MHLYLNGKAGVYSSYAPALLYILYASKPKGIGEKQGFPLEH